MAGRITRRAALRAASFGVAGAFIAACSRAQPRTASTPTATGSATPTESGPATCVLASEVTQGPYWLTDHPEASDLVQDRQGTPLALKLTVVDAACEPIGNAKVDIWHCDAAGDYAGVGGGGGGPGGGPGGAATRTSSENWLQGYQTAGANGVADFKTIYPGWYGGRAVHIHLKVFVGGSEVHTGQLFFPDDLSRTVFARAPYRGDQDTTNGADNIYGSSGSAALISPVKLGSGYAASSQLVVQS